ncbi:hypothetical protein ACJRO7_022231 [Eucalyptus globulus]|uniref:Neprosin PEP catalytic domain-containing protein n=1 Tax=Eucalyptus globulus TaxID=34317 RepID=A0ABD3KU23_EUCGL
MGLRKISFLAFVWFALLVGSDAEEQYSKQERRPIKTFKTIYGETIDCIDMYKQPAFDHPLLKDHKLQTKPSFPLNEKKHRQKAQVNQLERSHVLDSCPDGTIPILRRTKEYWTRAKLLEQTRPQIYHPSTPNSASFQYALLTLKSPDIAFSGARAFISYYIPKCDYGQFSGGQIWILDNNRLANIQVGWRVHPDLYGDNQNHFLTSWRNGTGCPDFGCQGFVQIDRSIALGQVLPNSSVIGGPQFELRFFVQQDINTKDWWLIITNDGGDIKLGYWPAKILPTLAGGARTLEFGGIASADDGMPFPAMGSGQFPDQSYLRACHVRQIQYFDQSSQTWMAPESTPPENIVATSKACYSAAVDNSFKDYGYTLLFGGPGGDNC